MVFEGIVGNGFLGDISIDDVSITPGPCNPIGSCTFEQDLCAWTPSNGRNDFDWYRLSSKQISLLYNGTNYPLTDTTSNNAFGHFLWAASDFRSNLRNQSSMIYSEILLSYQYQQGACMSFSYFLSGSSLLNFYYRRRPAGQSSTLVWSSNNDTASKWVRVDVDVPATAGDFEVSKNEQNSFFLPGLIYKKNLFLTLRSISRENLVKQVLTVQLH